LVGDDGDVSGLAGELRAIVRVVAGVAVVLAVMLVFGWLCELVRFGAAQLPAVDGADALSGWQLIGHGFLWTLEAAVAGTVAGALAWLAARHNWNEHRVEWHTLVHPNDPPPPEATPLPTPGAPDETPLPTPGGPATGAQPDEWAVQVVAGFNILLIAGLVALLANRLASLFVTHVLQSAASWVAVVVGALVLVGTWVALTHLGPLPWYPRQEIARARDHARMRRWRRRAGRGPAELAAPAPEFQPPSAAKARADTRRWRPFHVALWVLVALASLFASAPVGVLLITGAILTGSGRALSRLPRPQSATQLARSRLMWALLGIALLLGVAYNAMGPVGFPRVMVATASGELTGGYVARAGAGIDMVTCTALADATSTDARLRFIPAAEIRDVQVGGGSAYFDSGTRPSLARLALHTLGIGANPPTLFTAALRARQSPCAGTGPAATAPGVADPALGPGVVAGPAPPLGQATDGETPIQADTRVGAPVAALARRYQPTLLVTAADRNWPVSVNAYLNELSADGSAVCLVVPGPAQKICDPRPGQLTPPTGYLQLPDTLHAHPGPDAQFRAFLAGLGQTLPPRRRWMSDPSALNPWASAQIYFYYDPGIARTAWPKRAHLPTGVTSGMIGLEYWFFYPYNYYPVVIDSGLMNRAPLAGDQLNADLHQGDWEHVDVLINPRTMEPEWLYLARHDFEGVFIPWSSPTMPLDDGHPVVQAAFGGHPTYPPGCGAQPRAVSGGVLADWLACGSGRFAFRAATTPLVDLKSQPWACWRGYFGENGPLQAAAPSSDVLVGLRHTRYATPPRGPLVQAENTGVCRGGGPGGS
jgi:hypothetical protein